MSEWFTRTYARLVAVQPAAMLHKLSFDKPGFPRLTQLPALAGIPGLILAQNLGARLRSLPATVGVGPFSDGPAFDPGRNCACWTSYIQCLPGRRAGGHGVRVSGEHCGF